MEYHNWLESLTDQQLRALCCQCGVFGWRGAEVPSLRKRLLSDDRAKKVFETNYGKETSIQG